MKRAAGPWRDRLSAAVILRPGTTIHGLNDSKKLSAARRESLAATIRREALAWSVAWSDAAEIDALIAAASQ